MISLARMAIWGGFICLLAIPTLAQDGTQHRPPAVDRETYVRLAKKRDQLVAEAVEVLKSIKGDFKGDFLRRDPRNIALRVVSKFRAPEAVEPLCNMIDAWSPAFGATREAGNIVDANGRLVKGRLQVGAHFPAAKALVAIGLPGTRECLNRLRAYGCTSRSWLYLWVIRECYGKELGRVIIKERFTTGESNHVHPRCKEVLAEYDRLESYIEK